jgi:hypothetical protein
MSLLNFDIQQLMLCGKCGYDKKIWNNIVSEFQNNEWNNQYDILQFTYNEVFASEIINPAKIIKNDWKTLHCMWKSIISNYKSALT